MLFFDQLKKNDPQLRFLAIIVLGGFTVLLTGLWWVQIVRARDYRESLQTQSYRTVRVPAVRGKILDRNGIVLAEDRPDYSVGIYLEDLSDSFKREYQLIRPKRVITNSLPAWKRWLGFDSVKTQRVKLNKDQIEALEWKARYLVANSVVQQVAKVLRQPLTLDFNDFCRHYSNSLALPYPVAEDLNPTQIARFEEHSGNLLGADLEIETLRVYPYATTAAHVLGYLHEDDRSRKGEDAFFNYRLPDYRGVIGIEWGYDAELRGHAGTKAVLVNNLGYRQRETVWKPAKPGHNVVLTLDLRIQQAAEQAMHRRLGPQVRGAVVVMDVNSGDILALVSSPAYDPNKFVPQISREDYARLNDPQIRPQINRATQEIYAPGSIFKPIVGLACLKAGLNPNQEIYNPPNPADPAHGYIKVGRTFRDLAPPGDYDFHRALLKSCNTYFISNGLRCGIKNIIALGKRLHLGERTDLHTRQEASGIFPSLKTASSGWSEGDTANICIGQGRMAVTPLQMAIMASALANGGRVFWPRLVERIESQDPTSMEAPTVFEKARVRDELDVRARNLKVLREAMLADTEDKEGTAYKAFSEYYRTGAKMRVCGKTGTAEVTDARNRKIGKNTWFISFAPYNAPRYAVVVLVEGGQFGGSTCAPVACDIYEAIQKLDSDATLKTLAQAH
jgi:penicillin-binding protein 2